MGGASPAVPVQSRPSSVGEPEYEAEPAGADEADVAKAISSQADGPESPGAAVRRKPDSWIKSKEAQTTAFESNAVEVKNAEEAKKIDTPGKFKGLNEFWG